MPDYSAPVILRGIDEPTVEIFCARHAAPALCLHPPRTPSARVHSPGCIVCIVWRRYTRTVEEWMRDEESVRAMAEAQKSQESSARAAARAAAKEEREHDEGDGEEDEEERRKLVQQDEYRDMHKRGSGNRYNRN